MKRNSIGAAVVLASLIGCAKNTVYFGTNTNLAIDVDASSGSANIGYKNSQFASIPPKDDGTSFSILGSSDVDVSISDMVIEEEFATGLAAECAASRKTKKGDDKEEDKTQYGTLLFASYFSVSLFDVNLGADNPFLGASIGYKRSTATVIPIKNDKLRSVYAKTSVNTLPYESSDSGSTTNKGNNDTRTHTKGIRFKQDFATGRASQYLASYNAKSLTKIDNAAGCIESVSPPVPTKK